MTVQTRDLDCRKCSEAVMKIRGCKEEVEPYFIGDIAVSRCPVNDRDPKVMSYIKAYNASKLMGGLFNSGGITDQSGKMIDVFAIIEREVKKPR